MKKRRGARAPRQRTPPGDRLAFVVSWLVILLPPLVFDAKAKDNFRLPKELLSEVLALASLLVLSFRLRRGGRVEWRRVFGHPALVATLPLAAVAALGWLVTEHPLHVRAGFTSLALGIAILVGWSLGLTSDEKRRLLSWTLAPALLLAAFGILQALGLFDPFRFAGDVSARKGLTSLAGGAADLSSYLVLPALIAQLGLYRCSSWRCRAGWGMGLALVLYAVALTQTLTALAALAAATLVLWSVLLPPRRTLTALALAALLGSAVVASVGPLRDRVVRKVTRLGEGRINVLLTGRLDAWRAALWMWDRHPWLGVGIGAYTAEFAPARLALAERGVELFQGHREAHFRAAHNEYLEVAAECGWLGILALGWGVAIVGRELLRKARASPRGAGPPRADLALMASGTAGLSVLAVTTFPLHLAIVAFPHLLLLAWVLEARDPAPEAAA